LTTQFLVVQNNATGLLLASITSSQGTATLDSGQGANFPAAGPFHISIDDEIIRVDSRTGDVLTITRGQESTTPAAHNAASAVELRVTAKHITDLDTAVNALEAATDIADASYLTLTAHAGLSNERRFVLGRGLAATDGGANGDYTLRGMAEGYISFGTSIDGLTVAP
jgi:hypothetical protein